MATVSSRTLLIALALTALSYEVAAESEGHRAKRQTTFSFNPATFVYCINSSLTPGSVIGAITVINSGGASTWSITSPNSNFGINPNNGVLFTTNFLQAGTIQVLTVRVTSSTGISISTNVVIRTSPCTSPTSTVASVTSSTVPVFSASSYTFSTQCTLPATLGTASATGAATISYSLSGAQSTNIALNPSTGALTLFSRPSVSPITFTVIARNGAGSTSATVTVSHTCLVTTTTTAAPTTTPIVFPRFGQTSYTFVPACAVGSIVGQVFAFSNGGTILAYNISPSTNLAIDSQGNISVVNTALTAGTPITATVQAIDSLGQTNSVTVNITPSTTCTAGGAPTPAPAGATTTAAAPATLGPSF